MGEGRRERHIAEGKRGGASDTEGGLARDTRGETTEQKGGEARRTEESGAAQQRRGGSDISGCCMRDMRREDKRTNETRGGRRGEGIRTKETWRDDVHPP